jgi:DNA repair exonuclease SbcCD ATPase subunit
MSAIDLHERLTGLIAEIEEVNEQREILAAKRTAALSEQNEASATTIRHQLQELQEHLEDITFMRLAVEGKLRVYKGNAQKAAGIRKQIAGDLWPAGTKTLSKIQQAVTDLSNAIQEMDQLNGTIFSLTAEHEKLIGESVPVPAISNVIPQDLRRVVGIRLPELPETLELKVRSQVIRETEERQEAILNERISKQKTLVLPYLESADMTYPKCKTCSRELLLVGGAVYAGSSTEDGIREKAFRLQFRCEAGPHNGRQGFVQVDGGPYMSAPLSQLEIDRER